MKRFGVLLLLLLVSALLLVAPPARAGEYRENPAMQPNGMCLVPSGLSQVCACISYCSCEGTRCKQLCNDAPCIITCDAVIAACFDNLCAPLTPNDQITSEIIFYCRDEIYGTVP